MAFMGRCPYARNMADKSNTPENYLTRIEGIKGMHFIFLSLDRNAEGIECEKLTIKYFAAHQNLTLPNRALLVDLRPAFSVPLSDNLEPKTVVAVPIDYTLPTQ
jgi:hypothetical protein